MGTPIVAEAFTERDQKIDADGNTTEVEITYIVQDAADEGEALTAARTTASAVKLTDMALDHLEVSERINSTTWRIKAVFEESTTTTDDSDDKEQETYAFSFDTGGGSMHMNQSLSTVSKTPDDAPDFHGAIEVDNEGNVNGVDVTMPVLNFTETHTLAGTVVTNAYKKKVASLTGTVNSGEFRGFAAGEVLFLGASGSKQSKKPSAPWEITYRFAVSANKTSLKVGDLTVANKKGWDYLWVRYADKVSDDKKNVIKSPIAAYVEQVYPSGDFGGLSI